ncbi:MAG: hypothetical protein WAV47_03210 [Blastocatellia bacterium]
MIIKRVRIPVKKLALASYRKFLNLWRNADRDLPELLDAKLHLARLTAELSGKKAHPQPSAVR